MRTTATKTNHPLDLRDLADVRENQQVRLEVTDELQAVFAAVQRLPPKQQQVLHLRVIEELSVKEVASILQMTPNAVKTNLSLARKRLAQLYPPEAVRHRSPPEND